MNGAIEQRVDAEREGDLLDPASGLGGAVTAAFERERELGAHGVGHELGLGVLKERAGDRPEPRGTVLARIEPAERDGAGEAPAVEVGDEAAGGAKQRRLALAGEPGEQADLAGHDLEADVVERGRRGSGIAVADAIEGEHRPHGSIPRLSQKGRSTAAISAPHSAKVPAPSVPWMSG